MTGYRVFDDFVADPAAYRAEALRCEFRTLEFPEATFHGIGTPTPAEAVSRLIDMFPRAVPTMSFFRKSPAGQVEPHFIHTDVDMGDWSAILYLNPDPPPGDGTVFWRHLATGAIESAVPHERSAEGRTAQGWKPWRVIEARFNRLLLFPAPFFHSRGVFNNWGAGDDARLTQVIFGRGAI